MNRVARGIALSAVMVMAGAATAQGGVPLPVIPSTLLAESPASKRRNAGFTMFLSNSDEWFSPSQEEYRELVKKYDMAFDERYAWD